MLKFSITVRTVSRAFQLATRTPMNYTRGDLDAFFVDISSGEYLSRLFPEILQGNEVDVKNVGHVG